MESLQQDAKRAGDTQPFRLSRAILSRLMIRTAAAVVRRAEASGRRTLTIRADSSKPAQLTDAINQAAAFLGSLDNSSAAPALFFLKPVNESSVHDFRRDRRTRPWCRIGGVEGFLEVHAERRAYLLHLEQHRRVRGAPTTAFYSITCALTFNSLHRKLLARGAE
jgi:hypothetical protein